MTKISVVMPCYNHSDYVAQALQAVLSQTRSANEVIVIDDCSTDDSLRVIEVVTKSHPNVVIVKHAERGGVVRGMNRGLELANGELVAFLASDDFVSPRFIERSVDILERYPEAAFSSASVQMRDDAGTVIGHRPVLRPSPCARYIPAAEISGLLAKGDNFFLGASSVYRKRHLQSLGGFDEKLGSACDGIMQRRLAVRWGSCFLPQVLAVWRIHGQNYSTSSVTNAETLERLIGMLNEVIGNEPPCMFPEGYPDLLARRLRFNAARLLVTGLPATQTATSDLLRCTNAGAIDKMMLSVLGRAGPLASSLVMAWLTLRLHPVSLRWLAQEWLAGKFSPPFNEMEDLSLEVAASLHGTNRVDC